MTGFLLLLAVALHRPVPFSPAAPFRAPADSIGVTMHGAQRFVRHRVAAGETLSALSRRYHVSVAQITAANPQVANGLGVGQVVLVPRPAAGGVALPAALAAAKPSAAPQALPANGRYTVGRGDNLYAIARRFQLAPDDLIKLNNLPADGRVRVGQQLLLKGAPAATAAPAVATVPKPVPHPATPEAAPAPTPVVAPDKPAQIATVTPATPAEKEAEKEVERKEVERPTERNPTRASDLVNHVTESGLAAIIDNNGTDKYLALHKTAPVGTIMQVKNAMNGQSVYVRVIGKLPDTGENNNVLVRLSPRAVQKLGTSDQRFRVETSYVP